MERTLTAADRAEFERVIRASTNSEFEQKAADIIAHYLASPERAVVLCMGKKTPIQALDRLDRMLPLSPGRAARLSHHCDPVG